MIILPDLASVFCIGKYCVRYSYVLWIIIPIIFILIFLIRKNFVKFMNRTEQIEYVKERKKLRLYSMISRSLLFLVLLIAISSPFIMESRLVKGNPRLTILLDNSNSFQLYEKDISDELSNKLKGKIPLDVYNIGNNEVSAIGDGILNNLEGGETILVISDGNSNHGKLLGDVLLFTSSINSTVSTVNMQAINSDVNVKIEGPNELIRETLGSFKAIVNNVGKELSYTLEIKIDGEVIYSKNQKGSIEIPFEKIFYEGNYHKIEARLLNIGGDDYFTVNNVYYKSVKVVGRPKILLVTKKNTPLQGELEKIYDIDTVSSIPSDMTNYMTVILNDLHANTILPKFNQLRDYVSDDGNGLIFIGGENSYDRGSYKGTLIETLLPVKIGAGEESEKSDVQVVVIVDVSGSTVEVYDERGNLVARDYDRVIKALAVSVLDSLDDKTNVGIVVVGSSQAPFVGVVNDIVPLGSNKETIVNKISRLKGGGQSAIEQGIKQATKMLTNTGGGKNIILISDGRGLFKGPQNNAKDAVRQASYRAIKTYVVGVGATEKQEQDFLGDMAEIGNGHYWAANAENKLKILFGEPDKSEEDYYNKIVVFDNVHFITKELEVDAVISGYNYLVPKSASRLLVSTNKNIPMLAVWRFGLGRIVTFGTDDGGKWAGEMLSGENSRLLTRSINWAVGSLGRKKDFDVTIRDTTLGEDTSVEVISKDLPKHDELKFSKIDVNTYSGKFTPQEPGFYEFLGANVAVNYNEEYLNLGINEEFTSLITSTGGAIFEKDDIENIIDFVIEKSRRIKIDSTDIIWPFALLALVIFLIDIFIRKLWENKLVR